MVGAVAILAERLQIALAVVTAVSEGRAMVNKYGRHALARGKAHLAQGVGRQVQHGVLPPVTKAPDFSESLSDIFTDVIIADLKRTKRTTLIFLQKSIVGLADTARCVVAADGKRDLQPGQVIDTYSRRCCSAILWFTCCSCDSSFLFIDLSLLISRSVITK